MSKSVNLNWDNTTAVPEQHVYRSLNGGEFELIATIDLNQNTYNDPIDDVPAGSTIAYRVDTISKPSSIQLNAEGMDTIIYKPETPSEEEFDLTGMTSGTVFELQSLSDLNISIEGITVAKVYDHTTQLYTYTATINDGLARAISIIPVEKDKPLKTIIISSGLGRLYKWFGQFEVGATICFGTSIKYVPETLEPSITTMEGMFSGAVDFNNPVISNWDVSNVTNMAGLFKNASSFNQNINGWNVSNVVNMSNLFDSAVNFNQPLVDWDVSNVTLMGGMFYNATSFNHDLSGWCVSQVSELPFYFVGGSASLFKEYRPIWGTCPNNENVV